MSSRSRTAVTAAMLSIASMAFGTETPAPASAPAASSAAAQRAAPNFMPVSGAGRATPYQSAFEGYRAFREQPVGPWRQANDLVGRIGGWQAYAREGAASAAAVAPSGVHAGHAKP